MGFLTVALRAAADTERQMLGDVIYGRHLGHGRTHHI